VIVRKRSLIKEGTPCGVDFTDKSIQSISDAKSKGLVICSNYEECKKRSSIEKINCCRKVAKEMAIFILDNELPFSQAVEEEKKDFLEGKADGKLWVFRNNKWQVVEGKKNVIDDIVSFALIIIDLKPNERRPFTQDGKRIPELGPGDAVHNAALDIVDCAREIG